MKSLGVKSYILYASIVPEPENISGNLNETFETEMTNNPENPSNSAADDIKTIEEATIPDDLKFRCQNNDAIDEGSA